MNVVLNLFLILLLISLNAFFVAAEYSLVAVRKTRIEELSQRGNARAEFVKIALSSLDTYISATQLGITIASIALGYVGEPFVSSLLSPLFQPLPQQLGIVSTAAISISISFCLVTFFDVILGEIVPKRIALQKTEGLVLMLIMPLSIFATLFKPVIWLLNKTSAVILRSIGIRSFASEKVVHSEEEIKMIVAQSGEGGVIPTEEVEMVQNVFKLGDLPIKNVMVPLEEIESLDMHASVGHAVAQIKDSHTSRLPVYEKSINHITGFVHVKDLYGAYIKHGGHVFLEHCDIIREIIKATATRRADDVLVDMRRKRIHIAVVVDAKEHTLGIVTLEDVIESLVGEIDDEFDTPITPSQ